MSTEEIIRLIFSFLGGGLIAGLLDWIRVACSEKRARKLAELNDQLQNLYGPLYFFTSQNKKCFELNDSILKAYDKEYVQVKYSNDEHTQKNLKKSTQQTLDLANTYIKLVNHNNEKIIEILRDNYSKIDQEDAEVFQQFIVDYSRMKTEVDEKGTLKTPLKIYEHIGEISFMRPDFIEKVECKFISKKNEIKSLTK